MSAMGSVYSNYTAKSTPHMSAMGSICINFRTEKWPQVDMCFEPDHAGGTESTLVVSF